MNFSEIRIEKIFLSVAVTLGLLFTFIVPPLQVADEYEHFNRSYQISTLKFISEKVDSVIGGLVPESFTQLPKAFSGIPFKSKNKVNIHIYKSLIDTPLNEGKKVFVEFSGGSSYFPIAYLPQSIGIGIGRLFDFSPVILMYLGRVLNLLFWAFIVYWAIKIIPHKKNILFFLALSPMSVSQAASLSADGVTNALAFLFIACICRLAFDDDIKFTNRDFYFLCLIACLLSVIKVVFFIMILLIFIIPIRKFAGKKDRLIKIAVLFCASITCTLLWLYLVRDVTSTKVGPEVDMGLQLKAILDSPGHYLEVLYDSICKNGKWYVWSFIGILGWLDTYMPRLTYWAFTAFLIILLILDNNKKIIVRYWQKFILFFTFGITTFAIFTIFYLTTSDVGFPYVHGIQGRYFIPIVPLLFIGFNVKAIQINEQYLKLACFVFTLFINMIAVYSVINRYYLS